MKLRREYSLLEAVMLVIASANLWGRGVAGGSGFWFWSSLMMVFFFLIPDPDYWGKPKERE